MEFRPLHPTFGVEVRGVDLLGPVDTREVDELRAALDRHKMLLFRPSAPLPPARHVEVMAWFGPPIDNVGDGSYTSMMDNQDDFGRRELQFHSDLTYTDTPIQLISLQALEVPAGGTTTSYVSAANSWATLPPDLQEQASRSTLVHREVSSVADLGLELVARHPIRFVHPRTGEPILLISALHATRIEELNPEASEQLIADLLAHQYAPDHLYDHNWQVNDLLIWDNLALQHARRQVAELAAGSRKLQRVAAGGLPYPVVLEQARQAAAARRAAAAQAPAAGKR